MDLEVVNRQVVHVSLNLLEMKGSPVTVNLSDQLTFTPDAVILKNYVTSLDSTEVPQTMCYLTASNISGNNYLAPIAPSSNPLPVLFYFHYGSNVNSHQTLCEPCYGLNNFTGSMDFYLVQYTAGVSGYTSSTPPAQGILTFSLQFIQYAQTLS